MWNSMKIGKKIWHSEVGTSGRGVPVKTSQSKWKSWTGTETTFKDGEVSIFFTEGQASWSWAISRAEVGSRAGRTDKGSDTVIGAEGANESSGTSSKCANEVDGVGLPEQGLDIASATGLSVLVNSDM